MPHLCSISAPICPSRDHLNLWVWKWVHGFCLNSTPPFPKETQYIANGLYSGLTRGAYRFGWTSICRHTLYVYAINTHNNFISIAGCLLYTKLHQQQWVSVFTFVIPLHLFFMSYVAMGQCSHEIHMHSGIFWALWRPVNAQGRQRGNPNPKRGCKHKHVFSSALNVSSHYIQQQTPWVN